MREKSGASPVTNCQHHPPLNRYIQERLFLLPFILRPPFIVSTFFQLSHCVSHSRIPITMPLPTVLNRAITTTLIAAGTAGGVYAACVAQRIISVDSRRITRARATTAEFHDSTAIRHLANPRQHQSVADTRSAVIDIPSRHQDISDEELLARSIKAFYGGLVLGPERALLKAVGARLARFAGTLRPYDIEMMYF